MILHGWQLSSGVVLSSLKTSCSVSVRTTCSLYLDSYYTENCGAAKRICNLSVQPNTSEDHRHHTGVVSPAEVCEESGILDVKPQGSGLAWHYKRIFCLYFCSLNRLMWNFRGIEPTVKVMPEGLSSALMNPWNCRRRIEEDGLVCCGCPPCHKLLKTSLQ